MCLFSLCTALVFTKVLSLENIFNVICIYFFSCTLPYLLLVFKSEISQHMGLIKLCHITSEATAVMTPPPSLGGLAVGDWRN
jgi:hypothetical protein